MIVGDTGTKTSFALVARGLATQLIDLVNDLSQMQTTYDARGYASGGSDPITDSDILSAKITATQLSQFLADVWLASRIVNLMNGGTISGTIQGFQICDALRTDM